MERWICRTCGTQYPASEAAPVSCPICEDERQFIGPGGQAWTTLAQLTAEGFHNVLEEQEPALTGIYTAPKFGIGERALLLQTPEGNILWDCLAYIDADTESEVRRRGGIQAIAISHPHYYTAMNEWAERFGAPVYLSALDREWVMNPTDHICFWDGDQLPLFGGATVIRVGGHYPGSAVLHWQGGTGGKGALFTGDTVQVCEDREQVSFMYSYPNYLPLPAAEVHRIAGVLAQWPFDRLYGFLADRVIRQGAGATVQRSAERYIKALESVTYPARRSN